MPARRAPVVAACGLLAALAVLATQAPALGASAADLSRARTLDQQGVRAYREERYNDAIRFFEEARRLGGPPSEVWNIAKCHVRLDDPEEAAKVIEEYLELKGLSPGDRLEAEQQLHELQHRHSTLTVASSPAGATVFLEGHRWAGVTPATIDVPPGEHRVTIEEAGYDPVERSVEARWGRAVIVDVKLSRNEGAAAGPSAAARPAEATPAPRRRGSPHRLTLGAELGVTVPRFGSIGGSVAPVGFLSAGYVAVDAPRLVVTVGARATLTFDSWANTINAPDAPPNCGAPIATDESATAFSAFLDGAAAWRPSPKWRLGGDVGFGLATYALGEAGGDLFTPTCRPSPGVRPAGLLGLEASYALSRELRLVLSPATLELQPAFGGARAAPRDATGVWLRFAAFAGLAFDLL